ncbi:helix-turn-helix domain-containing protein [Halorubrum ezzemoulense]|uniref:Helix-turn-helix domain-containing protein n=1 Tax=Halorubrum ezzemoulense TaxID=337243 RepID=A0ABT4Z878_HALEZ|nr:helix-turn-helix domain-containing protein [Halorubrum ezzemoulense]MDB2294162.1 helix-turn-helix domain-containing protein [Halorubrum ezzemoulense]
MEGDVQYCYLEFQPDQEWFQPAHKQVVAKPAVTHELIHQTNLLDDGTAVVLFEIVGDVDRITALLEEHFVALKYQLIVRDDSVFVYAHFRTNETIYELLRMFDQHEIVMDPPMIYTEYGALKVTVVGSKEIVAQAIEEVDADVSFTLTRTGSYQPYQRSLFSLLTPKQQETLKTAIECGYYRDPREATYEDLAAELDCAVGTVGEHLRKCEAKLLSRLVP